MNPDIRGIVVCVGYDDILSITLRKNMRHLSECLVVTHSDDHKTKSLAASVPGARTFETNSFYEYGAKFNKGLAIELGFEELGRDGWILVWDADILFPESMDLGGVESGNLYTPKRFILEDVKSWSDDLDWSSLPLRHDVEFAGYFQLFNASDSLLRQRPWYGIDYSHCGGCDCIFQMKWPSQKKLRPNFNVLHIGPCDTNWFGRASERMDGHLIGGSEENRQNMEKFLRMKGWGRPRTNEYVAEKVTVDHELLARFS